MRRRILLFVVILFAPILMINLYLIVPEALEVARTGICPGTATDIPPGPCTIDEYLTQALFSPFAQVAQFLICVFWFGIVGLGTTAWWLWQRRLNRLKTISA